MAFLINDPLSMATDGAFSLTEGGGGDAVAANATGTVSFVEATGTASILEVSGTVQHPTISGTVTAESIQAVVDFFTATGEVEQ